ncbi:MAG: phytoene desaturase family protein [Propionibacteriaceae bacterium]
MSPADSTSVADVIIVGGGHNGLVAAGYLARTGRRVVVFEATDRLGGAVASEQVFPSHDARLSRFSYLVSVLPDQITSDLELDLELRSRSVASYTPAGTSGLLVERVEGGATRASFRAFTGDHAAYDAWQQLHDDLGRYARAVAPTLTEPLPRAATIRQRVGADLWEQFVARPLGVMIEERFSDDTIRGTLLTDGLIGTLAGAHDPSLRHNRCFLYHVVGNGAGEWRVPIGGMGAVAEALTASARTAGAELFTRAPVTAVHPRTADTDPGITLTDGSRWTAPVVLANCAPATLATLCTDVRTEPPTVPEPEGSQLKINLLVHRLPEFRSGLDPRVGFAGTLHLGQGYARLEEAHREAVSGQIPHPLPCEVYCHSLTDPSILGSDLRASGHHTLTLFGLHTPARLFRSDPDGARDRAREAALAALQDVLAEPLDDCLARDADGQPCVEVMTPLDVEAAVGMPGGHIFHGDLAWPWLADDAAPSSPAQRWGVDSAHPGVLLCGSGAVRGGAVSGLGGHNAAMAVLESAHP